MDISLLVSTTRQMVILPALVIQKKTSPSFGSPGSTVSGLDKSALSSLFSQAKLATGANVAKMGGTGGPTRLLLTAVPSLKPLTVNFGRPGSGDVESYGFPASVANNSRLVHTRTTTAWQTQTLTYSTLMGGGASGGPSIIGDVVYAVRSKSQSKNGLLQGRSTLLLVNAEILYNQSIAG